MLLTKRAMAVLVLLPGLSLLEGQVIQKNTSGPRLSELRVTQLLSKRNGLEECARLAGEFIMRDDVPLMARVSLKTLTRDSSLIVIGKVDAVDSTLDEGGSDISSRTTVTPILVIRGKLDGTFTLLTRGGKVTFPEGTSAQILTAETESINPGGRYIFFLAPVDLDKKEFRLTNGAEAIFALSNTDSSVQSIAARLTNDGGHPIVDEVKGLTAQALLAKVQTLATALATGQ